MFISPRSGARRLERLIWLKYYNVQKRQIILVMGEVSILFSGIDYLLIDTLVFQFT